MIARSVDGVGSTEGADQWGQPAKASAESLLNIGD
jgi:hypothetical protein